MIKESSPSEYVEPAAADVRSAESDPHGAILRHAWIEELGLWYDDDRADSAVTQEDPEIWDAFIALIVDVVRELHDSGRLRVPLLIDAEYLMTRDDAE